MYDIIIYDQATVITNVLGQMPIQTKNEITKQDFGDRDDTLGFRKGTRIEKYTIDTDIVIKNSHRVMSKDVIRSNQLYSKVKMWGAISGCNNGYAINEMIDLAANDDIPVVLFNGASKMIWKRNIKKRRVPSRGSVISKQ